MWSDQVGHSPGLITILFAVFVSLFTSLTMFTFYGGMITILCGVLGAIMGILLGAMSFLLAVLFRNIKFKVPVEDTEGNGWRTCPHFSDPS